MSPRLVVCYGAKGCGKSEERRKELGMTVEDYKDFCMKQTKAWKLREQTRKALDEATTAHTLAAMKYLKACTIPEKYQNE